MIRGHTLHFFEFYSEKNGIFGHFQRFVNFFSSKIKIFCRKRISWDRALTSQSDRSIHAPGWHILLLFVVLKIEEKLFFSKKFQNFRVLCLWVHIMGVRARA